MRRTSSVPSAVARTTNDAFVTLTRDFEVETLVHGGGVGWEDTDEKRHVRPIDPVTPVRTAAIRGQLRFWWRAVSGCRATSLDAMRERENKLWGAGEIPGAVALRVSGHPVVEPVDVFDGQSRNNTKFNAGKLGGTSAGLAYGAFAVAPKNGLTTKPPNGFLSKVTGTFTLILTYPVAHRHEVEKALDAWLLFGGVGGRVRRGFGAVSSNDVTDAERFLAQIGEHGETLALVPTLIGARLGLAQRTFSSAQEAMEAALEQLRRFRQGVGIGRNPGPGRSRWPEPDEIRRIARTNSGDHKPEHPVRKFPRAAFGMPIIFHFEDSKAGDPHDTTLQPASFERMASPLFLRPLRIDGRWRAAALILAVPGRASVPAVLAGKQFKTTVVGTTLSPTEIDEIKPLQSHEGADVLSRFMSYFTAADGAPAPIGGKPQPRRNR